MEKRQGLERGKFLVKWIAGMFIGLWLAPIAFLIIFGGIWEITVQLLPRSTWNNPTTNVVLDILILVLFTISMLVVSASFGLAQWKLALKDQVTKRAWISASAFLGLAGFVGLFLSSHWIPETVSQSGPSQASGMYIPFQISDNWYASVAAIGLVLGCAIGLPHWLVLRRHVSNALWWLVGNITGVLVTCIILVSMLSFRENFVLVLPLTYCFGAPLAFGAITGLTLYKLLQNPKETPPAHDSDLDKT